MPPPVDQIRVLVSSRHTLFSEAVKIALERESDVVVVASALDGPDAAAAAGEARPDVALVAARASDDTICTVRGFRERAPACRVVLLAADDGDEKTLIEALESGASGFVTMSESVGELVGAVRSANRGDTYVPQRMLGTLVGELLRREKDRSDALSRTARLTRREREVLALVATGADTSEIAERLVISPETARTHVQHVLCKLGVHSRLQAAMLVIDNDLLDALVETEPR